MRLVYMRSFIAVLSLFLIISTGAGMSAFGQGKGRGGGGGNKGGNPGGGGPPAGRQGPPQGQQMQRPQQQAQSPQPQFQRQHQQVQRPQPQSQRPEPQFQRPQYQAQRPQPQFQRPQPQMQRPQPQMQRPQPQYQSPQPQDQRPEQKGHKGLQQYQRIDPPVWAGRDDNVKTRGRDRLDDRANAPQQQQGPPAGSRAWPNNYGYQRSTEVHQRNAERKAARNNARLLNSYGYDSYGYQRPIRVEPYRSDSLRDNILRNVIVSTVANTASGYYYTPQDAYTYSNATPYYGNYGNSGYNWDYPQYTSYGAPLYYNFYTPYEPYVTYAPDDYGYNSYSTPYYSDYYADNVGLPSLAGSSSIGGFVGRMFSELLAYGYNQGYQDAQYARTNGYNTRYYTDPYDPYVYVEEEASFRDVGYNPYSCFGENRRYVSQGYELGYRDALYGGNKYDPDEYQSTNVDLISALISAVISVI
ncbi:MAG: hypothetical protein ABIV21_08115 [Pyrinomonadaceae bacterium]